MTGETNHLGQSYLIGEAALLGIGEHAAQRTYTGIDQAGYKHALVISHRLTELDTQREEFITTLRALDEAIESGIASTPSPIDVLIERLNALTTQITEGKAHSQLR